MRARILRLVLSDAVIKSCIYPLHCTSSISFHDGHAILVIAMVISYTTPAMEHKAIGERSNHIATLGWFHFLVVYSI
jgi:hypothetical protein